MQNRIGSRFLSILTPALTKCLWAWTIFCLPAANAQEDSSREAKRLVATSNASSEFARAFENGRQRSRYLQNEMQPEGVQDLSPRLEVFRTSILPLLEKTCSDCHGPEEPEANLRVDQLDPNMQQGEDIAWWLEVFNAISNGEMPPSDAEELSAEQRNQVIDWLSSEIQNASIVRRSEGGHSSFRRLTKYEYNYALQDLLQLPYDFADDLPPEMPSEDGFKNSSDVLQMSAAQFQTYRQIARHALKDATIRGERPAPIRWRIHMSEAAREMEIRLGEDIEKRKKKYADDLQRVQKEIEKLTRQSKQIGGPHYLNLSTGAAFQARWRYSGAKYAWAPTEDEEIVDSATDEIGTHVAVIPPQQKLTVELGNRVPELGILRIRIRASRQLVEADSIPSLRIEFGFQASNNSSASKVVSTKDVPILAGPESPAFYEWDIPLHEVTQRNPMRATGEMGKTPSPSEYIKIHNNAVPPLGRQAEGQSRVQIDYIEVATPVYESWPPDSHRAVFSDTSASDLEKEPSRKEVISKFLRHAWRGKVTESDVARKLALYERLRPQCVDPQETMVEVLATALSSPKFLYVTSQSVGETVKQEKDSDRAQTISDLDLAARLALFLWCSSPDEELLKLAESGRLSDPNVLQEQVSRMVADPRSFRFSYEFTRQWLGMQLLDYLQVEKKLYPHFDNNLLEAMQREPIEFVHNLLQQDASIFDILHADYTFANERLARHYGYTSVFGNEFRRIALDDRETRGGLLTQAGLLAMNSDGKDSHPLKRGIWLLESLLNAPPPPPPPSVPEIDLADPTIAKMTLKERLEDHRNDPACYSCHAKIDPWGIAFENFDAVGSWRTKIGDKAVDASSKLFNSEELTGMSGLKRFLLENRQDQFTRAMVSKVATYALGKPLDFKARAEIDRIATELRRNGDGFQTLVKTIACSDLFLQN